MYFRTFITVPSTSQVSRSLPRRLCSPRELGPCKSISHSLILSKFVSTFLLLSVAYIRIILSHKIGSSNPSHSHTWHSPRTPLTAKVTLSRCIRMSAEVRTIVLRSPSFLLSLVTEWNSGDRSQTILWSSTSNSDVIFHHVTLQSPKLFTEVINQAEWGTLYYAMKAVRDSHQYSFLLDLVMIYAGARCHVPNRVGC